MDEPRIPKRVCYLLNQYPKISHTFIRREIRALEAGGVGVLRVAFRVGDAIVKDDVDQEERNLTQYIVKKGFFAQVAVLGCRQVVTQPRAIWQALVETCQMMRRSARPWYMHLICLAEALVLSDIVAKSSARMIHAHFGTNAAEVAMLAHVLTGLPFSFTVHGPEEFDRPEFEGIARKISRAKFVVAISSYGRSQLYRWVPYREWEKIVVVRCGLGAEHLDAALSTPGGRNFLIVARLSEQKGHLVLIDACRVLKDLGVAFGLRIVGDGPLASDLKRHVAMAGLEQEVEFLGYRSSEVIARELTSCRAFVLPSFAEGLPVVIMEAMALGRPVISTFVAGIPELVDERVGWLVPPGDRDALAESMMNCLALSPDQLAGMGRLAAERVRANHDVSIGASRLAALFGLAHTREERMDA